MPCLKYKNFSFIIGERSEPPSDKLDGEICIATRALVCIYLSIYIYAYGPTTHRAHAICCVRSAGKMTLKPNPMSFWC